MVTVPGRNFRLWLRFDSRKIWLLRLVESSHGTYYSSPRHLHEQRNRFFEYLMVVISGRTLRLAHLPPEAPAGAAGTDCWQDSVPTYGSGVKRLAVPSRNFQDESKASKGESPREGRWRPPHGQIGDFESDSI